MINALKAIGVGSAGAILAATLVAAGCGSGSGYHAADGGGDGGGDAAACPTEGTGQLVLAMTGLPAGVTPMVRVSRGATSMMLAAGTPVTLNAGTYVIETRRVKTVPEAGSVVGKAFQTTTTFDGCVKPDVTTTAMITFVQEPGSDKLWATAVNPPVKTDGVFAGFAGSDLTVTAAKNPTVWMSKNTTGRGGAGAFDFFGNFWLPAGDVINMYVAATLGVSSDMVPAVQIAQPAQTTANFAAFDADGNLWVSRGAPGAAATHAIVRYAADALDDATPATSVVITSTDLSNPTGLAFDKFGDLWVADNGNNKLLKFAHGRLGVSFASAADVVITAKSGPTIVAPYEQPIPLAFDKTGNLWVGYLGSIVKFTAAQLAASSDVAAPLAINVPGGTGMFAFDESGGLWLAGNGGTLQRISATSLAAGGDVTPDIVITSSEIGGAESLVINPAPTWSPIHDAL